MMIVTEAKAICPCEGAGDTSTFMPGRTFLPFESMSGARLQPSITGRDGFFFPRERFMLARCVFQVSGSVKAIPASLTATSWPAIAPLATRQRATIDTLTIVLMPKPDLP